MDRERTMDMQRYSNSRRHAPPLSPIQDEFTLTEPEFQMMEKTGHMPPSVDSMSQRTGVSGSSMSKFADFFGAEVFQLVLHNPTTAHQMLKFSRARFCGENLEFLEKVDRYHELLNELTKSLSDIHHSFIAPNAPSQINLAQVVIKKLDQSVRAAVTSTLPNMEAIFRDSQEKIESLVYSDIYPRFVRYQVAMSATRALAGDRGKYQGLGDCFCLTSPAKADNPIVCASDGFVKVTGYSRSEIIPRNCRFLQGRLTEQGPVQRLKAAINAREESVELLLNYKKNGEPFWNLLYVAPLFNIDGTVAFFLGGQINCSTTIHSFADVLRVLSQSDDVLEDREEVQTVRSPSVHKKPGFFRSFRSSSNPKTLREFGNREAGMEQGLIQRIEGMNLKTQISAFYTAYSKYLIMSWESMGIRFVSAGFVEVLNPQNLARGQIVGTDVFKFLAQHATTMSKDFKSRVKTALRMGQAVSADIRLSTHRAAVFRGDEQFVTHWTPMKNEVGVVTFVVLTMGSTVSS